MLSNVVELASFRMSRPPRASKIEYFVAKWGREAGFVFGSIAAGGKRDMIRQGLSFPEALTLLHKTLQEVPHALARQAFNREPLPSEKAAIIPLRRR